MKKYLFTLVSLLLLNCLSAPKIKYEYVHIKTQAKEYVIHNEEIIIQKYFSPDKLILKINMNNEEYNNLQHIIKKINVPNLQEMYHNSAIMDGLTISFVFKTNSTEISTQTDNCYIDRLGRLTEFINTLIDDDKLKIKYSPNMKKIIGAESCEE